ncbi:MAG: hypothetical protein QNJ97_05220 [Myxococcota bacterium]|nr:hypothetical protein [Myxococcota bacterium]
MSLTMPLEDDRGVQSGRDHLMGCREGAQAHSWIHVLPDRPRSDIPLRIVAVTREQADPIGLLILDRNGEIAQATRTEAWGYIPRALGAFYKGLPAGPYRVLLYQGAAERRILACTDLMVSPANTNIPAAKTPITGIWQVRREWTPNMEDLFSVFVAKLFYVRPGVKKGWRPLHQAFQDPRRNILYGALGINEDSRDQTPRVILSPDCADAPYHVRAYFAWKMGLPFVFNLCKRGNAKTGATCFDTRSNLEDRFDALAHPVDRFNEFIRKSLNWKVHAGNPRTAPEADASDFYPIVLSRETIRPGVVFVDAGGHVLLVTQWQPQSKSAIGALYGIDAHPDRTVTHKPFSKGTFVFNHRVPTDGFKAFRPAVYSQGEVRYRTNTELGPSSGFPRTSDEQSRISAPGQFYNRVYQLLNPLPVDPRQVLRSKIEVLRQTMVERATAVSLGEEHMQRKRGIPMAMPKGMAIFQTTGPWEDYSTPARDMRSLLVLDDIMAFPKHAIQNLDLYAVDPGMHKSKLKNELEALRDQSLLSTTFQYTRSDGSQWTLRLYDIVSRKKALEVAYNPNDCPEIRWAAPPGSEERQTCKRRAPADQRKQMLAARHWFENRRRPDVSQ